MVEQKARALQTKIFIDISDERALKSVVDANLRSGDCLYKHFDSETARQIRENLEKFTANTKERFLAYRKYLAAINGWVLSTPPGESCDAQ